MRPVLTAQCCPVCVRTRFSVSSVATVEDLSNRSGEPREAKRCDVRALARSTGQAAIPHQIDSRPVDPAAAKLGAEVSEEQRRPVVLDRQVAIPRARRAPREPRRGIPRARAESAGAPGASATGPRRRKLACGDRSSSRARPLTPCTRRTAPRGRGNACHERAAGSELPGARRMTLVVRGHKRPRSASCSKAKSRCVHSRLLHVAVTARILRRLSSRARIRGTAPPITAGLTMPGARTPDAQASPRPNEMGPRGNVFVGLAPRAIPYPSTHPPRAGDCCQRRYPGDSAPQAG